MDYIIPAIGLTIIIIGFAIALRTRETARRKKFYVDPPY
jgi:hypothetical protein